MNARLLAPAMLLTLAACNGAHKTDVEDEGDLLRMEERVDATENDDGDRVGGRDKDANREGDKRDEVAQKDGQAGEATPPAEPAVVELDEVAPSYDPEPEPEMVVTKSTSDIGAIAGDDYEGEEQLDYDGVEDMESTVVMAERRGREVSKPKKAESKPRPQAAPPGGADIVMGATGTTSTSSGSGGGVIADMPVITPTPDAIVTELPPDDANEGSIQYGVNDMTMVESDAFSTFSIDVDTASYTISRRKLQEGRLPPTAAVRVEEFVNYFPYDYEAPTMGTNDGAPFAVHMEAAPNPWQSNHHVVRIGVKGAEIAPGDRAPVHLTFLVDVSGSMGSDDKLGLARESLHYMVNNLGEEDTIAIATYAGRTEVLLEPTSALDRDAVHGAIDRMVSGGGTNMDSGMELAYQMASRSYLPGAENRVIVLSDGDANIGRTGYDEILNSIENHAEQGITMTTVGFGMGNYKDSMMEQLANKGDGNYFYIDTFDEAQKVFGENLSGNMLTIAKDVKIQVEWNPDAVMGYRLIGYENRDIADVDFRNDRVDAGEIGSGHTVTALYDVILREDAKSHELATVRLRAKKPGPESPAKEWATVFDGELLHSEFAAASQDFQLAFAAATFAELLRGSPYTAELSYEDVWQIARAANRGHEEDEELLTLIKAAGALSGERTNTLAWK